jgi:hypothetical protein
MSITSGWRWPVLEARTELPAWAAPGSAFGLVLDPASVALVSPDAAGWRRLVGLVDAVGLDGNWSASVGLLDATLQFADGTVLRSAPDAYPRPVGTGVGASNPRGALERVLGARVLLVENSLRATGQEPLLVSRDQDLQNQAATEGHYRGRFHVQLTRHELETTLPLTSGVSGGRSPYHVVLDRAAFAYGNLDVRLREVDASSSFDRRPLTTRRFFLRNVKTSEVVEGQLGDFDRPLPLPGRFGVSFASNRGGFHAANIGLRFGPRVMSVTANGRPLAINASWLQDAEVVVVTSTEERAVERTLDIAPFRFAR